jgi:hypothetical protein
MEKVMQKVVSTEIISLDRDSNEYKQVMSSYLESEVEENGEEVGNEIFEDTNQEFVSGTKTIYTFDDGLVRIIIQLNFLSPTFIPDTKEFSNHIDNWSLFACQEDDDIILIQGISLHTFCMHEGGH